MPCETVRQFLVKFQQYSTCHLSLPASQMYSKCIVPPLMRHLRGKRGHSSRSWLAKIMSRVPDANNYV